MSYVLIGNYKTLYAKRDDNGNAVIVNVLTGERFATPHRVKENDILRGYQKDGRLYLLIIPYEYDWAALEVCEDGEWFGIRMDLTWQTFASSPKFPKNPREIVQSEIAKWLSEMI